MMALPADAVAAGRRLLCERARGSFAQFQRLLHPEASAEPYQTAPHLDAITWKLERVARGELKRLIVAAPPRHFKSYQVSVAFPPYLLGLDPSLRIVCASYGDGLASTFAKDSRRILQSPTYRQVFPKTQLSSRYPPVDELRTTSAGYRLSTSVGGPLTGKGADVLIVDDPLKADDASSKNARDGVYDWLKGTAMTRFDKPAEAVAIVVMQRLHQDDLIGRLIAEGGWELLELPAEALSHLSIPTGPDRRLEMKPGDILFPQRFDAQVLAERRRELGEAAFSAQYLQRPTPPGGHLFKLKQFGRFDHPTNNRKDQYEKVIFSMDTGVSTAPTSDYTAFSVWGVRGEAIYLLKADRGRWRFEEQLALLRNWRDMVDVLIVERSHVGIMLLQELARESGHQERLWGYTPRLEKNVRAEYAANFVARGRAFLPEAASWLEVVEQELAAFPHGTHDDLVDSFSQLVHILAAGAPPWFGLKGFKLQMPQVHGYLLTPA